MVYINQEHIKCFQMKNRQRNMKNFKLISFITFILICSSIAIADQKVISS